jgi:hypothetical protein
MNLALKEIHIIQRVWQRRRGIKSTKIARKVENGSPGSIGGGCDFAQDAKLSTDFPVLQIFHKFMN